MIKYCSVLLLFVALISCRKNYQAPIPQLKWSEFESATTTTFNSTIRNRLEGMYTVTDGSDVFGATTALKWSYVINGSDTTYHLSMFCEKQVVYIICEGRQSGNQILLSGYWRDMINTETGVVQLTISAPDFSGLSNFSPLDPIPTTKISGVFGNGSNEPGRTLSLQYLRPLYTKTPLQIVAHRGGGRTSDLLPASENTAEIIKLASQFGATGIEVDVRFTSDGVPILFHDETLNERLIQRNGMIGPIENYSYAQLNSLVRLINGEKIPTLREALDALVYHTALEYIWLDTKFKGNMQKERDIQVEYIEKAKAIGRSVNITIGIPDQQVLDNFVKLADYSNIPSVCELTPQDVKKTNAKIWGPRWTLGLQNDEVDKMHEAGRKAYVWTLDVPENISQFFNQGKFDGILTNYPSSVAYYYYAKQ